MVLFNTLLGTCKSFQALNKHDHTRVSNKCIQFVKAVQNPPSAMLLLSALLYYLFLPPNNPASLSCPKWGASYGRQFLSSLGVFLSELLAKKFLSNTSRLSWYVKKIFGKISVIFWVLKIGLWCQLLSIWIFYKSFVEINAFKVKANSL